MRDLLGYPVGAGRCRFVKKENRDQPGGFKLTYLCSRLGGRECSEAECPRRPVVSRPDEADSRSGIRELPPVSVSGSEEVAV